MRCTQKLLRRLKVLPTERPPPSTTALGEWYANLLVVRDEQLILCVSERALLPVVVSARAGLNFPQCLRTGLGDVLKALGAPHAAVASELEAMTESSFGVTSSRRILGSMNDFALAIEQSNRPRSLVHLSLWLAETPCGPLKMRSPDVVTLEVLRAPL